MVINSIRTEQGQTSMINWLIIGMIVVIMAKAAESEEQSPLVWGGLTAVLCYLCGWWIPLGLFSILLGGLLSYGLLFIVKLRNRR